MAKAFSTVKLLKAKEPFLRRMATEVRFQDGQLYLDHSGRLLKKLLRDPAWVVSPDPSPQGTTVFNILHSFRLSFSMHAASLDLDWSNSDDVIEKAEAGHFVTNAEELLGFVVDELEVTDFERLGFRLWYFFSFDSKEETEEWLRALGLFSFAPALIQAFEASPEAAGGSLVINGAECHYRIALNGIERAAQLPMGDKSMAVRASSVPSEQKKVLMEALRKKRHKQINSSYAAVFDIDAYRPRPKVLDIRRFLEENLERNFDRVRAVVTAHESKRGK